MEAKGETDAWKKAFYKNLRHYPLSGEKTSSGKVGQKNEEFEKRAWSQL